VFIEEKKSFLIETELQAGSADTKSFTASVTRKQQNFLGLRGANFPQPDKINRIFWPLKTNIQGGGIEACNKSSNYFYPRQVELQLERNSLKGIAS
jgi:hypothetical protein